MKHFPLDTRTLIVARPLPDHDLDGVEEYWTRDAHPADAESTSVTPCVITWSWEADCGF